MQVFAGACGNFPRRRWLSRPACRPAGGKWSDRHRTQVPLRLRPLPSAGQRLLCVLLLDSTMATATRCRTEGCTTSTTSTLAICSVISKIHVCLLLHAVLFTTAKRRKMSSTMSTCSQNSHYPYIHYTMPLLILAKSDVSQWKEVFYMCPLPIYVVHCNTL